MGRVGSGVEPRENSIRIGVTVPGHGRIRFTLKHDGQPLPPTPGNIKHAHKVAEEIRTKIRLGIFNLADYVTPEGQTEHTVDAQLGAWLNAQRIAPSTRAGYDSAAKFWRASIGHIHVKALRTSQVMQAVAGRADLSGKTVNNYISVLREAMQLAVIDGRLEANPVAAVPRARHQKPPADPFTDDERTRIIAWMRDRAPAQVHNMVEFWFWTGLRTSEVFGLRWPSVDLNARVFEVHEALVRGADMARTKTSVSRLVMLNDGSGAAMDRQRAHTQLAGGPVFVDPRTGKAWHEERAFRRSFWEPCLRLLGIRYRRPYNMRHTYATALLMSGVKPPFAAKQLGHSLEMFFGTYARWIEGDDDAREMARLNRSMSRNLPPDAAQDGSAP